MRVLLDSIKDEGKRIYGISGSCTSKYPCELCLVLIQSSIIDCVLEVSESPKIGKTMPATEYTCFGGINTASRAI